MTGVMFVFSMRGTVRALFELELVSLFVGSVGCGNQ